MSLPPRQASRLDPLVGLFISLSAFKHESHGFDCVPELFLCGRLQLSLSQESLEHHPRDAVVLKSRGGGSLLVLEISYQCCVRLISESFDRFFHYLDLFVVH